MEAEWRRDPRDGSFKLLEINPRQSMQNALPSRCGVNLILMAYMDAINQPMKYNNSYEQGIKWCYFLPDLASAIKTCTSIMDWIKSVKNVREWSYLAGDDVVPWIVRNFETASIMARPKVILQNT